MLRLRDPAEVHGRFSPRRRSRTGPPRALPVGALGDAFGRGRPLSCWTCYLQASRGPSFTIAEVTEFRRQFQAVIPRRRSRSHASSRATQHLRRENQPHGASETDVKLRAQTHAHSDRAHHSKPRGLRSTARQHRRELVTVILRERAGKLGLRGAWVLFAPFFFDRQKTPAPEKAANERRNELPQVPRNKKTAS